MLVIVFSRSAVNSTYIVQAVCVLCIVIKPTKRVDYYALQAAHNNQIECMHELSLSLSLSLVHVIGSKQ